MLNTAYEKNYRPSDRDQIRETGPNIYINKLALSSSWYTIARPPNYHLLAFYLILINFTS